jgi:hypothetical protein
MATEPTRKLFAGVGLAALRQGAKEIGTALKPLPDSISVDEPGGPFSPTQGEIAADNRGGTIWGRVQDNRERSLTSPDKEAPEPTLDRD